MGTMNVPFGIQHKIKGLFGSHYEFTQSFISMCYYEYQNL